MISRVKVTVSSHRQRRIISRAQSIVSLSQIRLTFMRSEAERKKNVVYSLDENFNARTITSIEMFMGIMPYLKANEIPLQFQRYEAGSLPGSSANSCGGTLTKLNYLKSYY